MVDHIRSLKSAAIAYYCAFVLATSTAYGAVIVNAAQDAGTTTSRTGGGPGLMPGILLALPGGTAGDSTLRAWSRWADDVLSSGSNALSSIWVICPNAATENALLEIPHVSPFIVEEGWSWAVALETFMSQNQELPAVGLLGEGALPHPALADSIESMHQALAGAKPPTAILTRARLGGSAGDGEDGKWLSDKFVSQVWCNRAVLQESRLLQTELPSSWKVGDTSLLRALPRLVWKGGSGDTLVLVDGTHVLRSIFDPETEPEPQQAAAASQIPTKTKSRSEGASSEGGVGLYIGGFEYALVFAGGGGHLGGSQRGRMEGGAIRVSRIAKAPWPPVYILEALAADATEQSKGLVLVSNVNCGYLDIAVNFWLSVQRVSSIKVLFVAMDEVAFDFMDDLDPGCTALFPDSATERHHSLKAGTIGDPGFAAAVLVRPKILTSILKQGYSALWSDADMVWLGNPLPLLPDLGPNAQVDMMLQYDGLETNKCTCFMFLNPTIMSRALLKRWEQQIVDSGSVKNQRSLQAPLTYLIKSGLHVDMLPGELMPAGREFFDHEYEPDYVRLHHGDTVIVHNNWVRGHEDKKSRFQEYHLWDVEDTFFPECSARV